MSSSRINAIVPVIGVGTALWGFLLIGSALIRRSFPLDSQRWYELRGTAPPGEWLLLLMAIVLVAVFVELHSLAVRKLHRSDIAVQILIPIVAVAASHLVWMIDASQHGLTTFGMMRAMLQLAGFSGASVLINRTLV